MSNIGWALMRDGSCRPFTTRSLGGKIVGLGQPPDWVGPVGMLGIVALAVWLMGEVGRVRIEPHSFRRRT